MRQHSEGDADTLKDMYTGALYERKESCRTAEEMPRSVEVCDYLIGGRAPHSQIKYPDRIRANGRDKITT